MNYKKTNDKVKIVLSVGDESGVGPEIILKALFSLQIKENIGIARMYAKAESYCLDNSNKKYMFLCLKENENVNEYLKYFEEDSELFKIYELELNDTKNIFNIFIILTK